MGKLTSKLDKGLKTLGLDYDPKVLNIVTYGKLAERGYHWDGENWVRADGHIALSYPASVRVMANNETDAKIVADCIAWALYQAGYVINQKAPVPNLRDDGFRVYIDVE